MISYGFTKEIDRPFERVVELVTEARKKEGFGILTTIDVKEKLKEKLGGVIILVMVVTFLEHLVEWKAPYDSLLFAIAVGIVSAAIIALSRFSDQI